MSKSSLTSETILKLKNGRASFLRLDKPKAFQEGQEPRYEGTVLLDPTNAEHATMIAAIKADAAKLVKEMWGEKPAGLKVCFGLADNDETKKKYDGYPGMFFLTMAIRQSQGKPKVVGRDNKDIAPGEKNYPYSGCIINTNPTLWAYSNKFGKGIGANLRIVQFVGDGKAFSGAAPVNAEDEFEAMGDAPASIDDDVEF